MGKDWFHVTSGWAMAELEAIVMVANDTVEPPIRHEMMHLIIVSEWGYSHPSCTWMNEGIATYAANNCGGFSVAELYRYFLEQDMLISMESLSKEFYGSSEMIAYHQAGYIAEYLITNYGIEKYKTLWENGMEAFNAIYGIPYFEMEDLMKHQVLSKYPKVPQVNWEAMKNGCDE